MPIKDDMVTKCWGKPTRNIHYNQVVINGKAVTRHRAAYEELVGPIPPGLELDHKCANRWCYNPYHLEPVTRAENLRRAGERTQRRNKMRHLQAYWDAGYTVTDPAVYNCLHRHGIL